MNEELRIIEMKFAEMRQAEANFRKAEAVLQKFYAKGPKQKEKSGRPPFWKSFHGLFFVKEVDDFAKKRKSCKVAFAIKTVKNRWCQSGLKDLITVATLAKLSHEASQVRYQEARQYWLFLLDPESYQKKEQSLQRNVDEALSAWGAATTALKYVVRASQVRIGARNPYDFS